MTMYQPGRGRNAGTLWVVILLGITYCGILFFRHRLTPENDLDGIIGVLLGLYICSRPAANFLDALFLGRSTLYRAFAGWSGCLWLLLNIGTIVVGWFVISVGATQFLLGAV
jgi:hypothetical protein